MINLKIRKTASLACTMVMVALLVPMAANAAPKKKKPAKKTQTERLIEDTEKGKRTGADLDAVEGSANPITTPSPAGTGVGASAPIPEKVEDEIRNNRLKTLDGSKSPFSGQFNLSYGGASITNPFSAAVPNPANEVPEPRAQLSGTVSARYRMNPRTSIGVGTGITTFKPFQGKFEDTSVSDPYVDIGRSYKLGILQGRVSGSVTVYTNAQYRDELGYRWGFSASNEAFYEFPFGLLMGLSLGASYNTFADGNFPDQASQPDFQLGFYPYFEYKLSNSVNLRSVTGTMFNLPRSADGLKFQRTRFYQTIGVGVAVTDSVFVYPYARLTFGQLTLADTTFGFSTIINLF